MWVIAGSQVCEARGYVLAGLFVGDVEKVQAHGALGGLVMDDSGHDGEVVRGRCVAP